MSDRNRARRILSSPIPDELVEQIAGNVSRHVKELPLRWLTIFSANKGSFSNGALRRIKVVEVSTRSSPEVPLAKEGRVVTEIDVREDMVNGDGVLHNGCAVTLIDECSILPVIVLKEAKGMVSHPGVSQTIDTFFHNPAKLGTKLRVVSTSVTVGGEMTSCRSEIWDIDNSILVATGVQLNMSPSKPHL